MDKENERINRKITIEIIDKLKAGMSRKQLLFLACKQLQFEARKQLTFIMHLIFPINFKN